MARVHVKAWDAPDGSPTIDRVMDRAEYYALELDLFGRYRFVNIALLDVISREQVDAALYAPKEG